MPRPPRPEKKEGEQEVLDRKVRTDLTDRRDQKATEDQRAKARNLPEIRILLTKLKIIIIDYMKPPNSGGFVWVRLGTRIAKSAQSASMYCIVEIYRDWTPSEFCCFVLLFFYKAAVPTEVVYYFY